MEVSKYTTIPLLIKLYDDGHFTPDFIKQDVKGPVVISKPRGRGLSLHDLPPGRIILMAGGTGIYPFSDTIDLLYKTSLVEAGNSEASAIKKADPITGQNAFKGFSFSLYVAVNDVDELHPITMFECNELAKAGKLRCFAKVKQMEKSKFQQNYPNITLIDERFQRKVDEELKGGDVSQFCVCGPTRFSKALVEAFAAAGVSSEEYRII